MVCQGVDVPESVVAELVADTVGARAVLARVGETLWVRLPSPRQVALAGGAVRAYGLSATERPPDRLQVTGWDRQLLRRRVRAAVTDIASMLAGWPAAAEAGGTTPAGIVELLDGLLLPVWVLSHDPSRMDDTVALLRAAEAAEQAVLQLLTLRLGHVEPGWLVAPPACG